MINLPAAEPYLYFMLAAGVISLLAAIVPNVLRGKRISPPILYIAIGLVIGFAGRHYTDFDIMRHTGLIRRLSEFVVIVALTNAGLKIKRPFSWETWKYSFRLLVITMPLTIVGSGFLGYWVLGLTPAAAVLFGALISPTDPVLAADMQTSPPSKKDLSKIRLGLTSEAGLNDGLAFPFTYFAIFLVSKGSGYGEWIGEWFYVEVLYKIIVGALIGYGVGWALYRLIFKTTSDSHHSSISRGILSMALTLLPYGIAELLGSYGFIAVFVAACIFSNTEEQVKHMDSLHDFTEEVERIFVAFLFIVVGIYLFASLPKLADFTILATAFAVLFVIRPLGGWMALYKTDLTPFEKFALSFYGIRGVGSVFYLMYAFDQVAFPDSQKLIHVTVVVIVLSVFIHGVSASWAKKRID